MRLVRLAMELQGELDAQEDHDRWTLQLHLRLECAAMPKLHHAVHEPPLPTARRKRRAARARPSAFGEDAPRTSPFLASGSTIPNGFHDSTKSFLASGSTTPKI